MRSSASPSTATASRWFPRLFGQGGFALIAHPEKLTQALPQIYRQLVIG